jgi:hypothetical protein
LVAIRPGRCEVLQRNVIEVRVVHGDSRCAKSIAAGNQAFHLRQDGVGRRNAGQSVMNALCLFARTSVRWRYHSRSYQSHYKETKQRFRPSMVSFHFCPRPVFHNSLPTVFINPPNVSFLSMLPGDQ